MLKELLMKRDDMKKLLFILFLISNIRAADNGSLKNYSAEVEAWFKENSNLGYKAINNLFHEALHVKNERFEKRQAECVSKKAHELFAIIEKIDYTNWLEANDIFVEHLNALSVEKRAEIHIKVLDDQYRKQNPNKTLAQRAESIKNEFENWNEYKSLSADQKKSLMDYLNSNYLFYILS